MRANFSRRVVNTKGLDRIQESSQAFETLMDKLEDLGVTGSREAALVLTHLEIAAAFAVKAISFRTENQGEPQPNSSKGEP